MSSEQKQDRDQLILDFYPMVRQVAYRMARRFPQCVDADDLVNIGMIGLMMLSTAASRPGALVRRGARIRVQGAIVDEMRKNGLGPRPLATDPR